MSHHSLLFPPPLFQMWPGPVKLPSESSDHRRIFRKLDGFLREPNQFFWSGRTSCIEHRVCTYRYIWEFFFRVSRFCFGVTELCLWPSIDKVVEKVYVVQCQFPLPLSPPPPLTYPGTVDISTVGYKDSNQLQVGVGHCNHQRTQPLLYREECSHDDFLASFDMVQLDLCMWWCVMSNVRTD